MKRILATAVALSAMVAATQAQAAQFILSGNAASPQNDNFKVLFQDATSVSATLFNLVGDNVFSDDFFFAPIVPASVGSGSATTNLSASLNLNVPNGLTITGYALDAGVQTALFNAFFDVGNDGYAAELAVINAYLAGPVVPVFFQAGVGDTEQQLLNFVPLSAANFYKISISGEGTAPSAVYSGNLSSTAVPEPGTWAMMLAGFGAVGFAMRRRRKEQPKVRFAF